MGPLRLSPLQACSELLELLQLPSRSAPAELEHPLHPMPGRQTVNSPSISPWVYLEHLTATAKNGPLHMVPSRPQPIVIALGLPPRTRQDKRQLKVRRVEETTWQAPQVVKSFDILEGASISLSDASPLYGKRDLSSQSWPLNAQVRGGVGCGLFWVSGFCKGPQRLIFQLAIIQVYMVVS